MLGEGLQFGHRIGHRAVKHAGADVVGELRGGRRQPPRHRDDGRLMHDQAAMAMAGISALAIW